MFEEVSTSLNVICSKIFLLGRFRTADFVSLCLRSYGGCGRDLSVKTVISWRRLLSFEISRFSIWHSFD